MGFKVSEQEEWRPVVGYEGRYEVSSLGRVKSLNYLRTGRVQVLKPGGGVYKNVQIGKGNTMTVHRLVAQAFCLNPNSYTDTNHINGDKHDNRAVNLEWCTRSQNLKHAYTNGLATPSIGSRLNTGKKYRWVHQDGRREHLSVPEMKRKYNIGEHLRSTLTGRSQCWTAKGWRPDGV